MKVIESYTISVNIKMKVFVSLYYHFKQSWTVDIIDLTFESCFDLCSLETSFV